MTDSLLAGIGDLLAASVREDLGFGDVTSEALVPEDALARAEFVSKESLVVAGIPVVRELVRMYDPALKFRALASDGARVSPGSVLIEVEGRARAIFAVERISLNFLQRLSGIATLTRRFVTAVEGTKAVIVDTRKTIPGHRLLDKYGVRMRCRRQPSHGAFRCDPDQEQSSGVSPRCGYGHRAGARAGRRDGTRG